MKTTKLSCSNVRECAEQNYVEAPASSSECVCTDEHRLRIALSEQRSNPIIFAPDHSGFSNAYCETYGRCKTSV